MLYILVFTRVSYHFDCCMIFDVVLTLYQHCSFQTCRAMREPFYHEASNRMALRFFRMYQLNKRILKGRQWSLCFFKQ